MSFTFPSFEPDFKQNGSDELYSESELWDMICQFKWPDSKIDFRIELFKQYTEKDWKQIQIFIFDKLELFFNTFKSTLFELTNNKYLIIKLFFFILTLGEHVFNTITVEEVKKIFNESTK